MACTSLQSILKVNDCAFNAGGINAIYIIDNANVTATTVSVSAHTITAIGTTSDFTTFDFNRNTGNFVADPKVDLINGSSYFEVTTNLVFHRREAAKSRALQILGEGQRFLDFIVLDSNGKYWYIDHAQLTGGTEETGTAKADGSKYNVTFLADMNNRPYEVDPAIVAALI